MFGQILFVQVYVNGPSRVNDVGTFSGSEISYLDLCFTKVDWFFL